MVDADNWRRTDGDEQASFVYPTVSMLSILIFLAA